MKRLWVQISLGFTAMLVLMVFLPLTAWNLIQYRDRRGAIQARIEERIPVDGEIDLSEEIPGPRGIHEQKSKEWIEGIPNQFVIITVSSLGVVLLTAVWISRSLSTPIHNLAEGVEFIAAGELDHRIRVKGSQEIIDLADSFNDMASKLQEAERIRNNMMADVAHDLRTPLTALETNLRAALDEVYELDENTLGTLYGQTRHLIRLVKDLELLTKADAQQLTLQTETVQLNPLIRETVDFFVPVGDEAEVSLELALADGLPGITADPNRIRQVLHNLIMNALHHTPAGGKIIVSTAVDDEHVRVAVRDTGDGIEEGQLPYIFDRFYRGEVSRRRGTGPDEAGSGLGLPIARAIITAHGGTITAISDGHNLGTTFTITLPNKAI